MVLTLFLLKNDRTNAPAIRPDCRRSGKGESNLVVRDKTGEIYTLRYEAVNGMLFNEFLKEHREIEKLEATACNSRTISRRRSCVAEKK